jgi:cytochrome c biogenesis factor
VIVIGELSLWVAFLLTAWAAAISFAGGTLERHDLIESGERAIYATFGMIVLAAAGLWTSLFTHDFSLAYVASLTSANLPRIYIFSAFWAGGAGSLLLWALILAMYASIAVRFGRAGDRPIMPHVTGTLALVMLLYLAILCFAANPFGRLDWIPLDGRGMNPDLQYPAMAVHRPSLYLGYAGTTIPFAFGAASLIRRRIDEEWLRAIRNWTMVAWFFSTAGIVLGLWWAYVERGGGREWVWAPLENASILPWLATSAFLYSVIMRGNRPIVRRLSLVLVVSAFLLSMFATFIGQSGMVWSANRSLVLPAEVWLAASIVVALVVTTYLLAGRLDPTATNVTLEKTAGSPRRYGRYVAYAGLLIMLVGFAGLGFSRRFDLMLRPGEVKELVDPFSHKWRLVSQGISQYDILNRHVTALTLDLSRDGKREGVLTTEMRQHIDSRGAPTFDPSTEAGISQSLQQDVYVELASIGEDQAARIRVAFNPLVTLVWIGGALMTLGGLIAMWPFQAGNRN